MRGYNSEGWDALGMRRKKDGHYFYITGPWINKTTLLILIQFGHVETAKKWVDKMEREEGLRALQSMEKIKRRESMENKRCAEIAEKRSEQRQKALAVEANTERRLIRILAEHAKGHTLAEISRQFHISTSRVGQLIDRARRIARTDDCFLQKVIETLPREI